MKVSVNWLRDYLDTDLSPAELARRITLAGVEVKAMRIIGGNWDHILVGQVLEVNPHPNADRLRLVTVDVGAEKMTVVCGAPNVQAGQKIAFAHAGAEIMNPHTGQTETLKPVKIRGVLSAGMVCSERELGISEEHEGILVLPADAPVGMPLTDYLGDTIFDHEVTPNRPDCLSVIGIARELGALTGGNLRITEPDFPAAGPDIKEQISVEIMVPDLCPRYCASLVTGIKVAESPRWMQERLLACGMRPINNVVDITNYVMLEYGQPLHAFDYTVLHGKKIIVRRAAPGEKIISLDGMERELKEDMLVIADQERPVAVAGVMGGLNSEVVPETTTILLEAASFKPTSIYYTARKLNMASEASARFERGIRAELTIPALKRATQLFLELAGGEAADGIIDIYPGKIERKPILISAARVNELLGTEFTIDQIEITLTSLGFTCEKTESEFELKVSVPYWRSDINLAVDLVEEVARIIGYDKIPMTMLSQPIPRQTPDPLVNLKKKVRLGLTGYGFQEVITFSLTSLELINRALPAPHPQEALLRLANPMTADLEYLRPNLRANLLSTLAAGLRYEEGGIRIFELGRVYIPRPRQLPAEPEMVCGIMSGTRAEKTWLSPEEPVDFYDAKGTIEGLMEKLHLDYTLQTSSDESLHPVKQAAILVEGQRVGVFGELHPRVTQAFEISRPTFLFEINLAAIMPVAGKVIEYQPLPRFPAVVRDIALILDLPITNEQVQNIIQGYPLVIKGDIFDVYIGKQVPPGKKSLAYRLTFQSPSHTLTDQEVNVVMQELLAKLTKDLGATLRT